MKKILLFCFSLITIVALAQDRTVSGRLTAVDDGGALPGVNVVVKGTATGTVTDADGRYSLSLPNSARILVFTFIGYETTEVNIEDRTRSTCNSSQTTPN